MNCFLLPKRFQYFPQIWNLISLLCELMIFRFFPRKSWRSVYSRHSSGKCLRSKWKYQVTARYRLTYCICYNWPRHPLGLFNDFEDLYRFRVKRFAEFKPLSTVFSWICVFVETHRLFLMAKLTNIRIDKPYRRIQPVQLKTQIFQFRISFRFTSYSLTCSGILIGFHYYLKYHEIPNAPNILYLMRYHDSYCDCKQFIKNLFRLSYLSGMEKYSILHEIREPLQYGVNAIQSHKFTILMLELGIHFCITYSCG